MRFVNRSGIEWVYIDSQLCTHSKAWICWMKFSLLFFEFDVFCFILEKIIKFSFQFKNKMSEWQLWSSFAYVLYVIFPVAICIDIKTHIHSNIFISLAVLYFTVTDCLASAHALYSHYCLQCFAKIQCNTEIGIYVSSCVVLFFFLGVWLKKRRVFMFLLAFEVNIVSALQNVEWNGTKFTSAQSLEAWMCVIHSNLWWLIVVHWEKWKHWSNYITKRVVYLCE